MVDRPSPNMSNNLGCYSYVTLRYEELQQTKANIADDTLATSLNLHIFEVFFT
ncbi:MAG: hypothetical protein WBE68_20505 [Candidatus Nitrosopolaris sp.]